MSPTLREEIERIKKICDSATKAPWYTEGSEVRQDYDPGNEYADCSSMICDVPRISVELDHGKRDRDFIAESRSALPRALAVIEELTKALEYIKEHELFHGVNQGVAHEQTVDKALSRAERLMRGEVFTLE
jgi:hypothetical protein